MICELSYSIEAMITRLQPTPGTTWPTYAQAMPSGIIAMMPKLRGRCENGIADVMQAQAYMLFYEQR